MKCERGSCVGDIDDGYCNVCGLAPRNTTLQAQAPASAFPPPSVHAEIIPGPRNQQRTGALTSAVRTTRRSRLAGGLVEPPPTDVSDPLMEVMSDPHVA